MIRNSCQHKIVECCKPRLITATTRLFVVLAALILCAVPSFADEVTFSGSTAGAPQFRRPGEGAPPTRLSNLATAVRYDVQQFTVNLNGTYTFESIATNFDNFTLLYQTSFNPASPLTNVRIGNDNSDAPDPTTGSSFSGFTVSLIANRNYFFVTTGFANDDFGAFTNTITGPGTITLVNPPEPIPEPATLLLLGTGLTGIVSVRKKRRAGKSSSNDLVG